MKFDWSTVGKAKHHCVVIFFSAVQIVHMFQVNKPGVDFSAAVLKSQKKLEHCFSLSIVIHTARCQSRRVGGIQVFLEKPCLSYHRVEHMKITHLIYLP